MSKFSAGRIRVRDQGCGLVNGIAEFAVDQQQSQLIATLCEQERRQLQWTIQITGHLPGVVSHEPPLSPAEREECTDFLGRHGYTLHISGLQFPATQWRQLEGQQTSLVFDEDDVFPILPGGPGNLYYCGGHFVPNHNRIRVLRRRGRVVDLEWKFRAENSPGKGLPVFIKARLPIAGLSVIFRKPYHLDKAAKIARKTVEAFEQSADLLEPVIEPMFGETCFEAFFPFQTDAE